MSWRIVFFSERLEAELLALSAGFLARFLRYIERLETYGPGLGMPHTRAMGSGLFELRIKAVKELRESFTARWSIDGSSCSISS